MFAKGARVALRSFVSKDPLKGTEHLLTAAGRATLTAHYAERSGGGAAAVATACDVSPSHLDAAAFFEDYDRHARPRGTSLVDADRRCAGRVSRQLRVPFQRTDHGSRRGSRAGRQSHAGSGRGSHLAPGGSRAQGAVASTPRPRRLIRSAS